MSTEVPEEFVSYGGIVGAMQEAGYHFSYERQCWIPSDRLKADMSFEKMCDNAIADAK